MFGRPSRSTGQESERNNRISAGQKLNLLNSGEMQRKVVNSRMVEFQTTGNRQIPDIISGVYLGLLSRYPTAEEQETLQAYFKKFGTSRRQPTVDLVWALINSMEFIYRH